MSGLSLVLPLSSLFDLVCNGLQTQQSPFASRRTSVYKRDMSPKSRTPSPNGSRGHRLADPAPAPPAAPPIIILSQNSRTGGSQPRTAQDPARTHAPHKPTSSPSPKDSSFTPQVKQAHIKTLAPKKPSPEPHPAPPVIILSHSTPTYPTTSPRSTPPRHPHFQPAMGSKASKIKPAHGKLQSSQEKKDKDEMKEPSNYYTHRSKSMRRKAGKEATADGTGAGSAGAGGVM